MNGLALCAGIGGLELGLHIALGEDYRTVCYVEREACAVATLVARMEDAGMDRAPIWDDIKTFDGTAWRGCVDIISAGFPCQPWSVAGQRKGAEDERWIWGDIARIIGEVGPGIVFLENVPGLLVPEGMGQVLGDLSEMGFNAEWGVFSAAEVGAPHIRRRVFILAYAESLKFSRTILANGNLEDGRLHKTVWGENWQRFKMGSLRDLSPEQLQEISMCDQPPLLPVDDGIPKELDESIAACGNGVVPIQAAMAFVSLWGRLIEMRKGQDVPT